MTDRNGEIHVFFCALEPSLFETYTKPTWEPEPDETATDEEYSIWEDSNPKWLFQQDLGDPYLDEDFIEWITEEASKPHGGMINYLATLLADPADMETICRLMPVNAKQMILIFGSALGGFAAVMKSTRLTDYVGAYKHSI